MVTSQVANHGIVDWYDPPMCPRSVEIIPRLLRSLNVKEDALFKIRVQARRLKFMLVVSWVFFVLFYVIG